jgi:hypothetical protein
MIRSHLLRSTAALVVIGALTACSDAPSSPDAAPALDAARVSAPATAPVRPQAANASLNYTVYTPEGVQVGDTMVTTFNVAHRKDGVYMLGRHWIYFQAGSICDPLRSTYGESFWNDPCRTAKTDIQIVAKVWADSAGAPRVEFFPHLRFQPDKYVILHMTYDIPGNHEPKILWFKNDKVVALDESANDEALVTQKDSTLMVYRRIKHFSGYTLSTGRVLTSTSLEGEALLGGIRAVQTVGPQPLGSGHLVATGAVAPVPQDQ